MEVAGRERDEVVRPSRELSGFIRVGEELGVALRITKSPAKLCVIIGYEVFRILVQVGGMGGGCLSLFCPRPGGGGPSRGLGLGREDGRLRERGSTGCDPM